MDHPGCWGKNRLQGAKSGNIIRKKLGGDGRDREVDMLVMSRAQIQDVFSMRTGRICQWLCDDMRKESRVVPKFLA